MPSLIKADQQAITSRFGEAVWLSDFITPQNPDVQLLHQSLTQGLSSIDDRIIALWNHVANIPYRQTVSARLSISGRGFYQKDTWLYPAETIELSPVANCANKAFLLTSLIRNDLPFGSARCVLGHLKIDGVGAHAWVEVNVFGEPYVLETTLPNLERALIPKRVADAYEPAVYFDEKEVYAIYGDAELKQVLNERFGFCAIPFLERYLCERCQGLEV